MNISEVADCLNCAVRGWACNKATSQCSACEAANVKVCSYQWDLNNPHIYDLFLPSANLNDRIHTFRPTESVIGGNFGVVYRAELMEGGSVAVKLLFGDCPMKGTALMLALRVAWKWSRLRHPNIIPFLGIAQFTKISFSYFGTGPLSLVSPYMKLGNIMNYLSQQPEADKTGLLLGIVEGLDYLHRRDPPIIHGGLRGNNILIEAHGNEPRAVITDFGHGRAKETFGDECVPDSTVVPQVGNPRWMAFERISPWKYGFESGLEADTVASDVFELLRTFLEVLSGRPPFYYVKSDNAVNKFAYEWTNPDRPLDPCIGLTDNMWALMQRGWGQKFASRPSLDEIRLFLGGTPLETTRPAPLTAPIPATTVATISHNASIDPSTRPSIVTTLLRKIQ